MHINQGLLRVCVGEKDLESLDHDSAPTLGGADPGTVRGADPGMGHGMDPWMRMILGGNPALLQQGMFRVTVMRMFWPCGCFGHADVLAMRMFGHADVWPCAAVCVRLGVHACM
eukprot:358695-Chlamydomonas_euryale.AAC.3